jgi:hypothetical protein
MILPVVFYGLGILSFTLREEHRLRVSEKWILKENIGPKRAGGKDYIMRSFTKYY